ncbi:MAG TPA: PIN domain-containing protein [Polyangia bacterium]|nr:PIN domain-containing protein [Polyangia bacterium]
MILIDSSAWVDFFRNRNPLANIVDQAIEDDEATLCGPVITELRRGLSSTGRAKVLRFLQGCHAVEQPAQLWEEAGDLGYLLGRRGVAVKTLDLLIAATALAYDLPILTRDSDFRHIKESGVAHLRLIDI